MSEYDIRWQQRLKTFIDALAFQNNIIIDGESWMEMILTRNKAVHTYDEFIVNDVINKTIKVYYPLYINFRHKMESLIKDE